MARARARVEEVLRRLLGVRELVVRGAHFESHGVEVEVRPRQRRARCGECGRPSPGYDTAPSRLWRHLALGRTVFWLRYAPRRVLCREHGVKVERVPWAAHGSYFTYEFEQMTAWLAQRMDRTATCRLMGINWRTVGTIIQRVVQTQLDPARLEELYVIGVDELSFRRHHEYVTVVVDQLKKRVVWVGEGKGEKTLLKFFDELGEERSQALTHVTMDLGAAYRSAVEARAPQAQKVFDLEGWAQWASRSKLAPFVKLSRTLRRFKEGILAYTSTGLSNGLLEGLNNKIRLITRRAFGFHSAQALTSMIHLCCGGLTLSPPLPVAN